MAEQLVEVPTDVVVVAQLVEQIVDTPVLGARGVSGYGGLQGFHPGQSSFQLSVEQIVDIPVPGVGLQDFLPDQGSAASSAVLPEEPFQRGFRTFPRVKVPSLVRTPGRNWVRTRSHPRRRLSSMTSSSTMLATCGRAVGHWPMEVVRCRHRRLPGRPGVRVWLPSVMALTGAWSLWRMPGGAAGSSFLLP